jgi:small subunit ribosomal protein S16
VKDAKKGDLVAVRIRMKMMGRKHRHYFRIVAIDGRQPRDGRIIEELGSYDPMIKETDARVQLKPDRIKYWMSVGAKPSERVAVLFKKYMAKFEQQAAQSTTPAAGASAPIA